MTSARRMALRFVPDAASRPHWQPMPDHGGGDVDAVDAAAAGGIEVKRYGFC